MRKTILAFLVITCAVGLGLGVAWAASGGQQGWFGWPALLPLALLAFAVQWLMFIPAYVYQTEHFYDLTGSVTYLLLILLALWPGLQGEVGGRALLLAALVSIWALRLGSFLFARVRRSGKDGRFDEIKTRWPRFLVAWTLQGLWVFFTLLAALIAISTAAEPGLDAWAVLGALIWLAGFAIEVRADAEKSAFNALPAHRGRFIQSGLWAWSRHPNYFGEILLWVGIAVIALPSFAGWSWLGLISPLFVTVLITRVSGVPLLEQRAKEKWGDDAEYQHYRDHTPVLIPRRPR